MNGTRNGISSTDSVGATDNELKEEELLKDGLASSSPFRYLKGPESFSSKQGLSFLLRGNNPEFATEAIARLLIPE